MLDASYQGVKILFVLAFRDRGSANRVTDDSHRRYFLPRVNIEICNIEIDGNIFYDQFFMINDLIKQYDEVRKASTGLGDDYTISCLLDFAYFKNNFRLIETDLSKQKTLDADSRACWANSGVLICYILKQSKELILQYSKATTRFCK